MARMRPVLFSSTSAAPCTAGGTRSSARSADFPLASMIWTKITSWSFSARRIAAFGLARGRTRPSAKPTRMPAFLPLGLDTPHRVGQIRLGSAEAHAPGLALIGRQALLERSFGRALQAGMKRRMNRVRGPREDIDAGRGLGFTAEVIDEVEPGIAADALVGGQLRRVRHRLPRLFGADRAVFLHPVEYVGHALPRPVRMRVGAEIIRALGQAGQERALGQAELAGGL